MLDRAALYSAPCAAPEMRSIRRVHSAMAMLLPASHQVGCRMRHM